MKFLSLVCVKLFLGNLFEISYSGKTRVFSKKEECEEDGLEREGTKAGRFIVLQLALTKQLSYGSFDRSNPTADEQLERPPEDLSSTDSSMADRHARAFTAVSAYGTSVALNKTRQRPVSAKVTGSQGKVNI